jgi:O-antigen ligase
VIIFFSYIVPFMIVSGTAFAFITWLVVGSRRPIYFVVPYLVCILYFPNASYGLVDSEAAAGLDNFYNRATGTFFFSAINLLLFGLALQAFIGRRLGALAKAQHNLTGYLWFFGLFFAGCFAVSFYFDDVRWFNVIGYSGLLNMVNMALGFYVLVMAVQKREDLNLVINVFLVCAVTRALFGAVRFVALGGDPANFYANFQGASVKLTFFDINDVFIATVACFIAAWRALAVDQQPAKRAMYGAIVLLELFIVVFSYRRTGWLGFGLAALVLAFAMRAKARIWLLAIYGMVGVPAIVFLTLRRVGSAGSGESILVKLMPDVFSRGQFSFSSGRFAELYAAWLSIRESPIFGLGTWGQFRSEGLADVAFHRGNFGWMHSGVLHVWLKAGFVGVVVLLGLFVAYARFVRDVSPQLAPQERGLLLAGVAGSLFYLPTWLIGTPVIEFRTMQLIAFALALPYLVRASASLPSVVR